MLQSTTSANMPFGWGGYMYICAPDLELELVLGVNLILVTFFILDRYPIVPTSMHGVEKCCTCTYAALSFYLAWA